MMSTTRVRVLLALLFVSHCCWECQAAETKNYYLFVGMDIFAQDGKHQYLGYIIPNPYHEDSIINDYGAYGSLYSSTSIRNPYSPYGSAYGSYSAYNPYGQSPPIIYRWNGSSFSPVAYLTKNHYLVNTTVDPDGLIQYLLSVTPAPTATPTITPTPGVTSTPMSTPTATPSATVTATPYADLTPTPTPEPYVTPTPVQTPGATATPTPEEEPIRALIRSFYDLVLGREPEAGAVDAWHHGYFEYAVNFNIDVRFIPREIARLFFLSEEYAARNRTNSEFITDCYRVFLNRDPSQIELDNWLGGEWNRPQVMTVFSESEEFANRIQAMYPGREGSPARNFVTFMYIGLLDRLVDKDGLEYAAGLFDAAFASGGVEAVRAQAKQMAREVIVSPEFLGRQPTTADYVVRFYRSFLGRFPNDTEIGYWTGELDSGRQTTDDLIELFADSAEFTARLQAYFGS